MKLNDAYEEVDEQRQSVASWKRKAQKAQGEANDIREGNALTLSPNTLSLSKCHQSDLACKGPSIKYVRRFSGFLDPLPSLVRILG